MNPKIKPGRIYRQEMKIIGSTRARNLNKTVSLSLLALVTLLLGACAGTSPAGDPLLERAQLRWESILSRDLDTAYSLYSPGYRSKHSRVDFEIELRTKRVTWTSAEYIDRECSENRCLVNFNVGYTVKRPVPGLEEFKSSSMIEDTWIKTRGEWWYVPPK